jgi:hypothetical protein
MKSDRPATTPVADVVETPLTLLRKAMAGDRAAFDELGAIAQAKGLPAHHYVDRWNQTMVMCKLQDRAGDKNLLARAGVERDVERVEGELAEAGDGPIERIIIGRAALCAADTSLSERDYQYAAGNRGPIGPIEALDRRRERSQRMLLATLRTLAAVRRINRPVVQVNVGDGNVNVLKA